MMKPPSVQEFLNQTMPADFEEFEVDNARCIEAFNYYDTDGNGYLDRSETMRLAKVGKNQTAFDVEKQITIFFLTETLRDLLSKGCCTFAGRSNGEHFCL